MPKKPYAHTRLAKFVEARILALKPLKTQVDIAAEAGYTNPNNITLIKQGASKLALDRVHAMARALDCDAAILLRMAFEQETKAASAIFELLEPLSKNERAWIEQLREASGDTDPPLTARATKSIRAIFDA